MTASTTPPTDPTTTAEVVRSEERLRVDTQRVPVERVRVTRRVVTETRTVEVQLRREELHVEHLPLTATVAQTPAETPRVPVGPRDALVLVLSREVPVVHVRPEPYETVRVQVVNVTTEQPVTASLLREQVGVEVVDTVSNERA